ncbi:MAG: helix-turn-helix domain-containing protein [Desulfatibacillaceae bacterium]
MPRKKQAETTGERIRRIREDKGVDLEQLANETGCSVETLEQIEAGETMPPVGTLLQISRALEIDSSTFLQEEKKTTKKARQQAYSKRTKNYAYTTLTPGAAHKHLRAFRVEIDAESEHEGVGYQHEGEEFVYVLKGNIEVTVGDHVNRLSAGQSLHFNSSIRHNLRNPGREDAELMVVVYTP